LNLSAVVVILVVLNGASVAKTLVLIPTSAIAAEAEIDLQNSFNRSIAVSNPGFHRAAGSSIDIYIAQQWEIGSTRQMKLGSSSRLERLTLLTFNA
jgi:hypothetical protein